MESEPHDAGIQLRFGIKFFWETLETESESLATGIEIVIGIMDFGKPWKQNQNWNQPCGIGVVIGIFGRGIIYNSGVFPAAANMGS